MWKLHTPFSIKEPACPPWSCVGRAWGDGRAVRVRERVSALSIVRALGVLSPFLF